MYVVLSDPKGVILYGSARKVSPGDADNSAVIEWLGGNRTLIQMNGLDKV